MVKIKRAKIIIYVINYKLVFIARSQGKLTLPLSLFLSRNRHAFLFYVPWWDTSCPNGIKKKKKSSFI